MKPYLPSQSLKDREILVIGRRFVYFHMVQEGKEMIGRIRYIDTALAEASTIYDGNLPRFIVVSVAHNL